MKKIIILSMTLILLTSVSNGQKTATQQATETSFGIRGGINFQNINGKDGNGDKMENDLVTRFHIGVNAEIPVAPDFYFQPGLLFTTKGAKNKSVILSQTVTTKYNLAYLELPLNLVYKPVLGSGRLILGFGPYIGFGIGGKAKYEGGSLSAEEDIKFKSKVKSSDPDDVVYFKPLDAGANLVAGYEFSNKVSFQLNTQLGLTKINPEYEGAVNDKSSYKNTGFGVSVGYRL